MIGITGYEEERPDDPITIVPGAALDQPVLARRAPSVPLPIAAEITVLICEKEPESYVSAARRLLARLASERSMPLCQLADVASILAELEADPAMTGGAKLLTLVQSGSSS